MNKTVLFVVLDQYADWEAAYLSSAIKMLGRDRFTVRTVAPEKVPTRSIGGFTLLPDCALDEIDEDYAAVALIGGYSWRTPVAQAVRPLVADCLKKNRVLGGICDAATFLGACGALNGVRHTCNDLADMKAFAGAAYTNENGFMPRQSVRDKNVVTANGTATLEFAKEMLYALEAAETKDIDDWYNFHKLGFYTVTLPNM